MFIFVVTIILSSIEIKLVSLPPKIVSSHKPLSTTTWRSIFTLLPITQQVSIRIKMNQQKIRNSSRYPSLCRLQKLSRWRRWRTIRGISTVRRGRREGRRRSTIGSDAGMWERCRRRVNPISERTIYRWMLWWVRANSVGKTRLGTG